MFTGIVTEVAEIVSVDTRADRLRMRLALAVPKEPIALGASVAVSGVCLTAVDVTLGNRALVDFDVGAETLAMTTAGAWRAGDRVNIERPLRAGDELGGHIVSGHVDGLAEIVSVNAFNGMTHIRLRAPHALARYVARKGSVAIDGVSLTVNAVDADDFDVLLIPHTLAATTLGDRRAGDRVNLEVDTIARYAERLLAARDDANSPVAP